MGSFDVGETVILSIEVKNDAGTLVDPATSINVVINRLSPNPTTVIASTAMTKDSVGKYHYDFASSTQMTGKYQGIYTATDGTRITKEKDTFDLE